MPPGYCEDHSDKNTWFLFIAVYGELPELGQVDLALYVSDSIENGVKNMRKNLEHRWDKSDFLKMSVPTIHFTDIRWGVPQQHHRKKFIVKGYGAKTGVWGAKEMGAATPTGGTRRPDQRRRRPFGHSDRGGGGHGVQGSELRPASDQKT